MKPNKTLTEDLEFFIIFISKIIFISITFNILFKKKMNKLNHLMLHELQ